MSEQQIEILEKTIDALRSQLRQARLENAIHRVQGANQPVEGLAEYLETEFPSQYLLLMILRAGADLTQRHLLPQPGVDTEGQLPVVYYDGTMMEQTEAFCQKHFAPRTMHILFPADMDMGLLLCPNGNHVSDASIQCGDYLLEVREQLAALLRDMDETFGLKNTATVSRIWQHRADLRQMYLETKDAYDYSWDQEGNLHTYDDFCADPMSSGDKMTLCGLEEEFNNDATHLLFDEASVVLSNILDMMFRHGVPLSEVNISATARLRNILTILEYNTGASRETMDMLTGLLQRVSASVSIPELQDRIFDFFAALGNIAPVTGTKKITQILDFIEANCKNPNLNADMICDRFHISRTYLSKLIKKETGFGLVDAIHKARLSHAKQLLRETELTTEQVATQVGFTSRYGLIRAFRSQEQITPTEYRSREGRNI